MKAHKILQNEFTYTPLHLIPGMPPRKPDNRMPLLWLARKGGELYLVNNSGETLDWVGTGVGGFISADDEILPVSSAKDYIYEYRQVVPHAAVKVEEYDGYYDLDYVLSVTMEVKSARLGHLQICSPAEKGGVKTCVLIWDTGEAGKHVGVKKLDL